MSIPGKPPRVDSRPMKILRPERTFQEMADILFLLRVPGIDEEEVKGYFEKQGLIEKYHEIKKSLKTS